ncbi:MAG: hypothetical protein U1A78_41500 [Polyangia bacterium]
MDAHRVVSKIEGWTVVESVRLGAGVYFQRPIEDLRACTLPAGVTIDPAPPPPDDQVCCCDGISYRCVLCGVDSCCTSIGDDSVCPMCESRLPLSVLRVMHMRQRKGKRRGGRVLADLPVRDRPAAPPCLAA